MARRRRSQPITHPKEHPSAPTAPPRPTTVAHDPGPGHDSPPVVPGPPAFSEYLRSDGMRVVLRRVQGLTDKGFLDVPYHFQCPPMEQIKIDYGHNHSEWTTIHSGTYSRAQGPKLRVATFSTLVTDFNLFSVHADWDVDGLTEKLERLALNGVVFEIIAAHLHTRRAEIQMFATLVDFGKTEKGGEPDARYMDVNFTEWRDPVVRRKKHKAGFPKKVKLGKNDTLHSLAKKYYGRASGARWIAQANRITNWGFDTKLARRRGYKVGKTKLKIPVMPEDLSSGQPQLTGNVQEAISGF